MTFDLGAYSWIPPEFVWVDRDDVYVVKAEVGDPDLVELVVNGLSVTYYGSSIVAFATSYKLHRNSSPLMSKLARIANTNRRFLPENMLDGSSCQIKFYFLGAYVLQDDKYFALVVSKNAPGRIFGNNLQCLQSDAAKKYAEYMQALKQYEQEKEFRKQSYAELKKKLPELLDFECAEHFGELSPPTKPKLAVDMSLLSKAIIIVNNAAVDDNSLKQEILRQVVHSGRNPPRDGVYHVLCALKNKQSKYLVVSWLSHEGLPSYSELRWAVQKKLPEAFEIPRESKISSSHFFPLENVPAQDGHVTVDGGDEWLEALDDVEFDDSKFDERTTATRQNVQVHGFEAIAWYQPFHVWDEETWGIYMDAQKIDDLALTIFDDSKKIVRQLHNAKGIYVSQDQSAKLAFGLVYNHELFHARIEAALTWMELICGQSRLLRYKENVYRALLGSDDLLEEALANWASWDWFQNLLHQHPAYWSSSSEIVSQVVETCLDISPPGYRQWRSGKQNASWRELCAQMSQGAPVVAKDHFLPLEGLLSTNPPFDFRTADIPLHIVGSGTVINRILSHPASFHVPPRKEIERALKLFQYSKDSSSGKGSHEKWTGPDNRAFALPKRDPLSGTVFKHFLEHFNINKRTYVQDIRARL